MRARLARECGFNTWLSIHRQTTTYDCNNTSIGKDRIKPGDEIKGEQRRRLNPSGEDVMDDVVILCYPWICRSLSNEFNRVIKNSSVILGKSKVPDCKIMDNRVNFDNRRVDSQINQCRRTCSNSKATVSMSIRMGVQAADKSREENKLTLPEQKNLRPAGCWELQQDAPPQAL